MTELTVIIPTLNEARNIGPLIDEIRKTVPGAEIIVADDGSADETQKIAKARKAKVIDRSKAKVHGLTASVIDAAKATKTEFLVVMDADFQHPPLKLAEIAELAQTADVIVCARKKTSSWSTGRKAISGTATLLAKGRIGKSCSDPLSGFFGAKTALFNEIVKNNEKRFQKEGYKVLFDFLKCLPRETAVKELSYEFGMRKTGSSKLGRKQMACFLKSLVS